MEEDYRELQAGRYVDPNSNSLLLKQAQQKIQILEKELNLAVEQGDAIVKNLMNDNDRLRKEVESYQNALRNQDGSAREKNLLKENSELKEQIEDAKKKIGIYQKEITILNQSALKGSRDPSPKINGSNQNFAANGHLYSPDGMTEKLVEENSRLKFLLKKSNEEKAELFKRFRLYDQELTKQEDYFKNELKRLQDEIKKDPRSDNMESTLLEDLVARFADLQARIKKERQRYDSEMERATRMAEDVKKFDI
jgi:hypothetical protein